MARPATASVRFLSGEREPVRVATTANITLSGLQTVDGVALAVNDRVLVKDQTDPKENGIYTASEALWYRASDANFSRAIGVGVTVTSQFGSTYADRVWRFKTEDPIIGTDPIVIEIIAVFPPIGTTAGTVAAGDDSRFLPVGTMAGTVAAGDDSRFLVVGTTPGTVAAGDDSRFAGGELTIRNYAAGKPIGLGVSAPLSAHYASLALAQVDFPAATSLANEIAGLAAQKAADDGVYQWGAGGFYVNTTIAIKRSQFTQGKGLSPVGRGRGQTAIYQTHNAPLFTIASDTGEISGGSFGGFTHYVTGLTAGTYTATRTVSFLPTSSYYIQKNAFRDIHTFGAYGMFAFNGATTTTGFGQEGRTAWNRFSDLEHWPGATEALAMFEYNSGSSTGNVYDGIQCGLGVNGSVMLVNGSAVFGDVVMEGLHAGGTTGSCILRMTGTPAYLNNIRMAGQADAGIANIITGNASSVLYSNIDVSDLLMGGGVAWYSNNTPYLVGSNIRGANSTNQQFGKQEVFTSSFGARNRPLFNVFVRNGDAVRLKLTVSGQVGGLDVGSCEWDWAFNGFSAVAIGTPFRQNASASFFNVSTGVGTLTFNVNLTLTDSANSEYDAQLRVLSGRCRVQVL